MSKEGEVGGDNTESYGRSIKLTKGIWAKNRREGHFRQEEQHRQSTEGWGEGSSLGAGA